MSQSVNELMNQLMTKVFVEHLWLHLVCESHLKLCIFKCVVNSLRKKLRITDYLQKKRHIFWFLVGDI